jgi:hypothetical protein
MNIIEISGLRLYFEDIDRQAAEVVSGACERSMQIIRDRWGLKPPGDCQVYLMTSWKGFLRDSAPWTWKIMLALTIPLWYGRISKMWTYAGGWVQRYGRRIAVGIKPPRLIEVSDRSMGELIFFSEEDPLRKLESVTCHELTHAFTSHLKLPMWLNEGLAMVTVDGMVGAPTVRPETLDTLRLSAGQAGMGSYGKLRAGDTQGIVYHTVRGYWITRYIEEVRPGLLKHLLMQRRSHSTLENEIAAEFSQDRTGFWSSIDGAAVAQFGVRGNSGK